MHASEIIVEELDISQRLIDEAGRHGSAITKKGCCFVIVLLVLFVDDIILIENKIAALQGIRSGCHLNSP